MLSLSLWLTIATWIDTIMGLGFRLVGGGGVVSFIGWWVAAVWCLSCEFVQWDCVGLCWIFRIGFDGVYYGWVLMGWVHGGRGGFR